MQALKQASLYEQLENLPQSLTGEILNGQLHAHPRPSGRHILAAGNLNFELLSFNRFNGDGGWWILQEPEVHFLLNQEIAVPDLAGWRKERLPEVPAHHKFIVAPDWICEIFSPSTELVDKEIKMPLYAKHGVKFLWFIHPIQQTLQAFRLVHGEWQEQGFFNCNDLVNLDQPFPAVKFKVSDLFI